MYAYDYTVAQQNDELYHYGVKGMQWGVRRATKRLSKATTSGDRDKAVASLKKHKAKATAEIESLQKKRRKLDANLDKSTKKDAVKSNKLETKAAKLDKKIAKNTKKAGSMFTSQKKATELMNKNAALKVKSDTLHAKASTAKAKYEKAKLKVEKNERMQQAFKRGINDIDKALVDAGKRYMSA